MTKKLLTLEQKFNKYSGRNFSIRLNPKDLHGLILKIVVVGYVKDNNHFLIGLLEKNQGVTDHFKTVTDMVYVENHKEGNQYIYVNISCIERYPEVKKVIKKRAVRIDDDIIDIDELRF